MSLNRMTTNHFFDSLIPALKTFTLDQKLEFRSEVLKLVTRIRSSNIHSSHHHTAGASSYVTTPHHPIYPTPSQTSFGTLPHNLSQPYFQRIVPPQTRPLTTSPDAYPISPTSCGTTQSLEESGDSIDVFPSY